MENLNNSEQQRLERATKHVKAVSGFYRHLMVYVLVNIFLLVVKYFNLDRGENFLEWNNFTTAFWWGLGLAFHALSVFGSGLFLGKDWEEKKIREIMDKQKNQKWE